MDDVAVLTDLLRAYSPSGRESDAVNTFFGAAERLGYRTHVDRVGNGFASVGAGKPQVMFLGHIDTVEGELAVRVEDGRVYGRGACDAKGALAAALLAAKDHRGPGEVVVVAAVGEEKDSRGARYLIPRHKPDFLIVGEPSGWDAVTIAYKGNLTFVATFEGERAHLSSPEPTTVETALAFVERVRAFCEARKGPSTFLSPSAKVSAVQTRATASREVVKISMNVRLPPSVATNDVIDFLNGANAHFRVVDRSEAVEVSRGNTVVRELTAGIRAEDARPRHLRKAGTADLNLAVPAWKCPAAAYGPGDSHLDHTDRENLRIDDYRRATRVLEGAFSRLLRHQGS